MISNEGREFCRGIGLLAEHIICMADSFEEPIEKFRKSLFYSPEFEDKGKIIQDILYTMQDRVRKFKFYEEELSIVTDVEEKGKHSLQSCERWMNWGMVLNGKCLTAQISLFPNPEKECTLSDIVISDAPEKYYLSQSATHSLLSKSLEEIKDKECTT